jgi:F-type H+-transporting ATPase subunit a
VIASLLQRFAAPEIHVSLKAEPIFSIGPLHVTNSMIYGVITAIIICVVMISMAKRITLKPRKGFFTGIFESMVEFVINLLEGPFGSREQAARFTPIFGVYFIFIIFSNLLELVPWVGEGIYHVHDGAKAALFRPFTADLNGTIALAVIAIVMVQILSIKEQGPKKHLQHYFSDKPLSPVNFFIGMLEVFGEFTRVLSLSLRLFLNTAVGEILITVFTSMILAEGHTPLAVLPIFLFEALVAFIQAYVFTVLSATYLGLAISHAHEHSDDHHETPLEAVDTRGMHGG